MSHDKLFPKCGILAWIDSDADVVDEPEQPPFELRNSK